MQTRSIEKHFEKCRGRSRIKTNIYITRKNDPGKTGNLVEKDKKEMEKKKKNMFILDDKKKEKTGQTNQKVTSAKGSPELEGQKRPV